MRLCLLALAFASSFFVSSASAQQDLFAGCEDIAIPVPEFSCADGYPVPKQVVRSKCEHPEDLYNRCVLNSRLGVLSRGEDNGVDIVFSCRTDPDDTSDPSAVDPDDTTYYDIAAIQYERSTGKTCFYQYLGEQDIDAVLPAPLSKEGRTFWGAFGNDADSGRGYQICTRCHTNNAFVRTPHYDLRLMDVYDVDPDYTFTRYYRTDTDPITVKINARDRLLPDIYATQKYLPLNSNGKISWIAETGNSCNACHSVGYFYDVRDEENKLGRMNDVVSGYHHSLRKRTTEAPSFSTYDDFMVERVRDYLANDCIAAGGKAEDGDCETWRRAFAIEEVKALHACVADPTANGCKRADPATGDWPYEKPGSDLDVESTMTADTQGKDLRDGKTGKIIRQNRPEDPSHMAGLRFMKRYGDGTKGYCLSAIGPDISNGTKVKQVPCNKTYGNNSQNWLYDNKRGLVRSAQHPGMCLTVRPLYRNASNSRKSYDYFEGSETIYPYYSETVLWDCNSRGPKGHFLNTWNWNGIQTITSLRKPEFCLSGQDDYLWTGEDITNAYVAPCTRHANGSLWILTTETTVNAAVARLNQ